MYKQQFTFYELLDNLKERKKENKEQFGGFLNYFYTFSNVFQLGIQAKMVHLTINLEIINMISLPSLFVHQVDKRSFFQDQSYLPNLSFINLAWCKNVLSTHSELNSKIKIKMMLAKLDQYQSINIKCFNQFQLFLFETYLCKINHSFTRQDSNTKDYFIKPILIKLLRCVVFNTNLALTKIEGKHVAKILAFEKY